MTGGAWAVFGWAALIGTLAVVMTGFWGWYPMQPALYGGGVILVSIYGFAVLRATRKEPLLTNRVARKASSSVALGFAALMVGVGLFYGYFFMMAAALPLLMAARAARWERAPEQVTEARMVVIDEQVGYVDAQQVPVPEEEEPAPEPAVSDGGERRSVRRWVAVGRLGRGVSHELRRFVREWQSEADSEARERSKSK
jgi:hypothetical protein